MELFPAGPSSSSAVSAEVAVNSINFTITDYKAPLFSVENLSDDGERSTALRTACQAHFPQFHKRGIGWRLGVEEVHYLVWLAQAAEQTNDADRSSPCKITVTFAGTTVEQAYDELIARHPLACAAYAHLSHTRRLRLRHAGSLYGALFIGYGVDTVHHGEYLFFAGPLEPLAATRARRVASSVGKRACEIWLAAPEEAANRTTSHRCALGEVLLRDLDDLPRKGARREPATPPPKQRRRE